MNIYKISIIIGLIFSVKYFQSSPFQDLFFVTHALFLLLCGAYIIHHLFYKQSFFRSNLTIQYIILLSILVPIYSSFVALFQFNQPLYFGFLSSRGWMITGFGLYIYDLIKNKKISLKKIEQSFILLAFISLFYNLSIYFFVDPNNFSVESDYIRFTETRGYRFKLNFYFILYACIGYFTKLFYKADKISLISFLIFFSYIVFIVQSRAILFVLFLLFIVITFHNSVDLKSSIRKIIYLFSFTIVLFISSTLFNPSFIDSITYSFEELLFLLSGNLSNDPSINSRLFQSITALDFLSKDLLTIFFGAGNLSHQFYGGFSGQFIYFYPTDIGILGALFQFGFLGIIFMYLIPLILFVKNLKKKYLFDHSIFTKTLIYIIIFFTILTLFQGTFFFEKELYIVIFLILFSIEKKHNTIEEK